MMNEVGHPGRREAVVALAVACVLVLVSWLSARGGDKPATPVGDLTSQTSSPNDSVVNIDLYPTVTEAQVQACLTSTFATTVADAQVLYAEVQKTEGAPVPVLVLRNKAGELRLCDSFGGDAPSVAPVEYADAAHAVRLLSNGRQAWDCDGTRLAGFTISHWLSVSDSVDRVELRFLVDGTSSPWFSTQAQRGFVHLRGWLGEQIAGATITVQTKVLDKAGNPVPQDALPTTPQPLTGCEHGPVQIG
jgi:hypothetical protein